MWCISHNGTDQSDGSSQWSMAGYGIGGAIADLRFTAAEARAAPGSSTDPYLGSGTIKPARTRPSWNAIGSYFVAVITRP